MKVKCNVGTLRFQQKPPKEDSALWGRIHSDTKTPVEIEVSELATYLANGGVIRAAALSGGSRGGFISQQVWVLDFDGTISLEWALWTTQMAGLSPCFIYRTFNPKQQGNRFRFVYVSDRPIFNIRKRDQIQNYIYDLFGTLTDEKLKMPEQLILGTDKGIAYANYENRIYIDKILPRLSPEAEVTAQNKPVLIRPTLPVNARIDAIRNRDIDALRTEEKHEFSTNKDFSRWLVCEASMPDLLGVTARSFCCLFHEDSRPSATIFQAKTGAWLYHCHSANCDAQNLNMVRLVQRLGQFESIRDTFAFLREIYNVRISSIYADKAIAIMDDGTLKNQCPTAWSNIRWCRDILQEILKMGTGFESVFYMSIDELTRMSGKTKAEKVGKYVKMLVYHGFIDILPDTAVPKELLANVLKNQRTKHHANFYRIPDWNLSEIEKRANRWRESGYRVDGITYEGFYRAEGNKVASWLYPQTAHYKLKSGEVVQKKPSLKSDKLHMQLTETILHQIEVNGYCTEKTVLEELQGGERMRTQWKKSLRDILNTYELTYRKCNSELKQIFGIQTNGYPFIIYRG